MKRILAILLCAVSVALLCGCGTTVDCYYRADTDYLYYEYRVSVADGEAQEIEKTAAVVSAESDKKWTVREYLKTLSSYCGWSFRSKTEGDVTTYFFNAVIPNTDDEEDEDGDGPQITVDKGFLYRTVTYTQKHPLSESFKAYADGTAKENSITYIVKNGHGDLPALTDAFPALTGFSEHIELSFYWQNGRVTPVNGDIVEVDGQRYIRYTTKAFEDGTISYSYRTPNPAGWYTVIGVLGVVTVVVILLATRKRKSKPSLVDTKKRPQARTTVYFVQQGDIFGGEDIFGYAEDGKKDTAKEELEDIFGLNDKEDK